MGIKFNYADVNGIPLKGKNAVKKFIIRLFELEGKKVKEVNYIFCGDDYLLKINRSFLQHDYYTDIITFDLSEGEETIAEVYISVDRVKENAKAHGVSVVEEMLRVVFHGALHLIGYKDKKKSEITVMREKEDYYLRLFGKK
jgi:rRNA maturation RNase YbeY